MIFGDEWEDGMRGDFYSKTGLAWQCAGLISYTKIPKNPQKSPKIPKNPQKSPKSPKIAQSLQGAKGSLREPLRGSLGSFGELLRFLGSFKLSLGLFSFIYVRMSRTFIGPWRLFACRAACGPSNGCLPFLFEWGNVWYHLYFNPIVEL